MHRIAALLVMMLLATAAAAQTNKPVYQTNLVSPGHVPVWTTDGVIQDNILNGQYTANAFGITAPGLPFCINDALTTSPSGFHQFCFGANATISGHTGAFMTFNAYGGAPQESLFANLNGTTYEFPFTLSGIVGPVSTTIGDAAVWANSSGTLLSDLGAPPAASVATIAGLQALSLAGKSAGFAVMVQSYVTPGDMPPDVYTLQTSPCSNAGAGDGGSQIPSNTSGNCWLLSPSPAGVVFQNFGVVADGTDPNNNNSTLMNAAIAYAGTLNDNTVFSSNPGLVPVTALGASIAVCHPVIDNMGGLSIGNIQLSIADPSCDANFPTGSAVNGVVTGQGGVLEITTAGRVSVHDLSIELGTGATPGTAPQPVNGFTLTGGGFNTIDNVAVYHWGQSGTAHTVIGTAASAVRIINTSDTSAIAQGMVSRGNIGIPDQTVITKVISNTSFSISQATTGSLSSQTLSFYLDGSGMVLTKGGRFSRLNLVQYQQVDTDVDNEAKRAGFAFWLNGGSDTNLSQSQLQFGASPVFMSNGSTGLYMQNVQIQSGTGSPYTPSCTADSEVACNSPCYVVGAGSNTLTWVAGQQSECVQQYFQFDSTAINLQTTTMKGIFGAGALLANPNNWIQVWTNQSSASLCSLQVGPSFATSAAAPNEITLFGPGSFSGLSNGNLTAIASHPNGVTFTGCSYMFQPIGYGLEHEALGGFEPTINDSAGFGTGASVASTNGTAAFVITLGTSPATTAMVTMPTIHNGWGCGVTNLTHTASNLVRETTSSGSSITVGFYNNSGTLTAGTAADNILFICTAY